MVHLLLAWLLWEWLDKRGGGCSPSGGGGWPEQQPAPGGGGTPQLPATTQTSAPPWPAVAPTGLPPFPGPGWEYDEPPPPAVVQRARELSAPLWRWGKGQIKQEQTAGRWITYRAEIVASGKQGVVAYREKRPRAIPPSPPSSSQSPPPPSVPFGVPHPSSTAPSTPSAPQAPSGLPPSFALPVLSYGMGLRPAQPNQDVVTLQLKLQEHGFMKAGSADGRFGTGTRDSVLAFQKARGLAPNLPNADLLKRGFGVVREKTWSALFLKRAV